MMADHTTYTPGAPPSTVTFNRIRTAQTSREDGNSTRGREYVTLIVNTRSTLALNRGITEEIALSTGRRTAVPWIVYDKGSPAPETPPLLGIQKGRNLFSLNAVGAGLLKIEGEGTVELLFDPEEKLVGLRKVDKQKPTALHIRKMHQTKGNTYLIATRDFTRRWGISTDEARRYTGQMQGDVLTFDLKQQPINGQSRPRYDRLQPAIAADDASTVEKTAAPRATSGNGDSNIAVVDR